jgi:DNA modification methylase
MPVEPDDFEARESGPPAATAIRSDGDPALAGILADALALHGRVERATHGFHTYPAGMHADAAKLLIEAHPGAAVHDPFCGGGTVLVEALLAGRAASGTDLSPVATLVSTARTSGPEHAGPLRSASRRITEAARQRVDVFVPEDAERWYEPHVAQELGRLRDGIQAVEEPETRARLWAVLSSIVVKASFRESDTSNRRKPGHRPPGTTAVLFHKKARELGRMLDAMPAERAVKVRSADARKVGPPPGTGLVLTSPPYPGVYDYLPMQQLRFLWMDIDPDGRMMAAELGSRRAFRSQGRASALRAWREDTFAWVARQAKGLAAGGRVAINVGDGLVGGRTVDTLSVTVEAMREAGLRPVARASADRPDHARDSVRIEHIVLAEKPGA